MHRARRQGREQRLVAVEHRQAMQPRPDALGRPLLQPHAPLRVARQQHPQRLGAALELARLHRVALGRALAQAHAARVHRADHAAGLARQADRGAQVHQALRVVRHRLALAVRRQQLRGEVPQRALLRRRRHVAVEAEHARQHALHVAVEDGHALAETEGRNRGRRRTTDAGQGHEFGGGVRKGAAEARDHLLRAAVHVARAAVVAQAAPQAEHLVLGAGGQRRHVGEALEKAREVAQHGRDLGLLEHHLREPDAVRIARVLPRQFAATVAALPAHDLCGEIGGQRQGSGNSRPRGGALRPHAVARPRWRRPRQAAGCRAARSAR
ncbi:hypothetical protein D9M72_171850 [compost metagenome]